MKHSPATPLPWAVPGTDGGEYVVCSDGSHGKRRTVAHGYDPQNAAFIVHAANAYPRAIELLQYCASHAGIGNPLKGSIQEFLRSLGESE